MARTRIFKGGGRRHQEQGLGAAKRRQKWVAPFNVYFGSRRCRRMYGVPPTQVDSCYFVCPNSAPPPKSLFVVATFTNTLSSGEFPFPTPSEDSGGTASHQTLLPIQGWACKALARDFLVLVYTDLGKEKSVLFPSGLLGRN